MRAWVIACVLAFSAGVAAADAAAPSPAPRKLIVATHEGPPFIIKNADGSSSGISIDLWRHVAETLRLDYEIRDMAVADMLAGAKSGAVDVVVSLNITAEREKAMDLTHAFFSTGLGIAAKPGDDGGWTSTARQLKVGARTTTDGRVTVLPGTFENPLRESIDVALLEFTASDEWRFCCEVSRPTVLARAVDRSEMLVDAGS